MKKLHWFQLVAFNLLVGLCILLPFLPGPYDRLSLPLSGLAQLTGYMGLLLVPIGIFWLIEEIKKLAGTNKLLNNWNSGFYFAIAATCICTFLCLIFTLALSFEVGMSASIVSLVIIVVVLYKLCKAIRGLRHITKPKFNATPLYLLSIPLIAFTVSLFFVSPVSELARNYAIKQGEKVIDAIESYRDQRGSYPQSIEYLYDLPKPSIMGSDKFIYELNGDAYNLSFVQHQHLGATREVVMYNKNDEQNVKGHFAAYDAKQPHWKYYWQD
ncbi:MAG TPA: hypothetical protein VEV87_03295 [Chitinophagaceae bacterium]|nr:hypothetical protein [Chitinophagaceae bacterium]